VVHCLEGMDVKNMSCFCDRIYILPASIRKSYKVGGFFTLIGLLGFTLFMLGVGLKQDTNRISCFAIAAIFGMVFMGCLITWRKNYSLIDAIYCVDDSAAMNRADKLGIKVSVDLRSAASIDYTHSFYIGKGSFNVEYTIFSANTLSDSAVSAFEGTNIYKILRKVWESGSVILPKHTVQRKTEDEFGH